MNILTFILIVTVLFFAGLSLFLYLKQSVYGPFCPKNLSALMVVVYDSNLTIKKIINPQEDVLLGYSCDKLIGSSLSDLERNTDVQNKEQAKVVSENVRRALQNKIPSFYEYSSVSDSGSVNYSLGYVTPPNIKGEIYSYVLRVDELTLLECRNHYDSNVIETAINSIPTSVFLRLYDKNAEKGDYLFFNTSVKTLFGTDDIRQSSFWNQNIDDQMDRELISGKLRLSSEVRWNEESDGAVDRYLRFTKTKQTDKAGRIYIFTSIEDLTEFKKVKMNESEITGKFRKLFNQRNTILKSLPVAVELYTKEGNLIEVNNREIEIFGIENKEQAISKGVNLFRDNKILPQSAKDSLLKGESFHIEIEHDFNKVDFYDTNQKGVVKYLDCKGSPVYDESGNVAYYVFIIEDVSDSRNRESQLRTLNEELSNAKRILSLSIEASSLLPWEYDCKSRMFVLENKKTMQHYSLTFDQYFASVVVQDYKKVRQVWNILTQSRNESFDIEVNYHTQLDKSGKSSVHYGLIHGEPTQFDENGAVVRYTGFGRDDTRWHNLNAELKVAKEKAEESNRLKSAFLANMSHEIRTPLNAIVGFSELMLSAESDDERNEYFNIISSNNKLLLGLIGDILDLSKIESGMIEIKPESFDLCQLIKELHASLSVNMTNAEVEFTYELPMEHCFVVLDKIRISQVITNFVNNARKFTSKGFIKIRFALVNDGVWISVKDSGKGIPSDKVSRIFDRFYKVDEFAQGTGLGTSICKAIATALKGDIGVNSELGKGSEFWVWFPTSISMANDK